MKKRWLCGVLTMVLLFSAVCHGMTPAEVDGAVAINTVSCRTLLQHILGITTASDDLVRISDFDTNGVVNTADVRDMLIATLKGVTEVEDPGEAFRLSSISDKTGTSRTAKYTVTAPYDDTYTLKCSAASSIKLSRHGQDVASGTTSLNASLVKGAAYTLTVTTSTANKAFDLTAQATDHYVTLPYDVAEPADTSGYNLYSNAGMVVQPTELNYQKRDGGTYIYSNNPEKILNKNVGKAFIRNTGLTGDVFFTFEHSNFAESAFYLGYQVKNEGSSDVFITVTNIGYQSSGDWYGREAWCDYYNIGFKLPSYQDDAFLFNKSYSPRVFQPQTYRLPAGKAMWVIGGTTSDAYNNINVGNTANKSVAYKACANGSVKFTVTGGSVTGAFYCYRYTSQVAAEPAALGYLTSDYYTASFGWENYAVQYIGKGDHHGVIDNYAAWSFNDTIGSGTMPVTFTNYYDENCSSKTSAYAQYDCTPHYQKTHSWATHINPHEANNAVGEDMVEFACTDDNGRNVVVGPYSADATGKPANIGNWMIEYQDHFTLVNQGNKTRTLHLNLRDHGSLVILVRDSQTGEVLETAQSIGKSPTFASAATTYSYTVTVPAHSVKQVTLEYVLIAQSYGNVYHSVSID